MTRRGHSRYALARLLDGKVEELREAVVQRSDGLVLLVASGGTFRVGEHVVLDLIAEGGTLACDARVTSVRPVVLDDVVRHEITLELVLPDAGGDGAAA